MFFSRSIPDKVGLSIQFKNFIKNEDTSYEHYKIKFSNIPTNITIMQFNQDYLIPAINSNSYLYRKVPKERFNSLDCNCFKHSKPNGNWINSNALIGNLLYDFSGKTISLNTFISTPTLIKSQNISF